MEKRIEVLDTLCAKQENEDSTFPHNGTVRQIHNHRKRIRRYATELLIERQQEEQYATQTIQDVVARKRELGQQSKLTQEITQTALTMLKSGNNTAMIDLPNDGDDKAVKMVISEPSDVLADVQDQFGAERDIEDQHLPLPNKHGIILPKATTEEGLEKAEEPKVTYELQAKIIDCTIAERGRLKHEN